ncbi:MAG: hypothetical protein MUP47_06935 [Phycisphaerae bacterium]|nr:hypothetical protein [Phycisphaerae bacterium]
MNTCVVCGAQYPRGQSCPRCRPQRYRAASGGFDKGKWGLIAVGVAVFLLLMIGAYFVIKGLAKGGQEYGQALHGAQERGSEVGCTLQLTNVYRSLQIAAMSADGKFPASLGELYSPGELHCPSREGPAYVYVPGQDLSMPGSNVLVYEAAPAHDGKCSVLRLNGRVELLTPEALQAELDRTRRAMAPRRR